jgi:hypothetical protein
MASFLNDKYISITNMFKLQGSNMASPLKMMRNIFKLQGWNMAYPFKNYVKYI